MAFPSVTFISRVTVITRAWLQAVNDWIVNWQASMPSVFDYMTAAQIADVQSGAAPTLDSSAAWNAFLARMALSGGEGIVPPGNYLQDSQITITISTAIGYGSRNFKILGYGATLFAGPAVTGAAIKLTGSYNFQGQTFEGLTFNHLDNTTVNGCFEILGGHFVTLDRCMAEMDNTKAGWYFARFASRVSGAGENDANSFWCRVIGCRMRVRSGSFFADYGLLLEGAVNAFTARDNEFTSVKYGVYSTPAPTTLALPNGMLLDGNNFEDISTKAVAIIGTPGVLGPTGIRVINSRVETCPIFFSFTTGGASALPHSQPPWLTGNYCTTGSVTTWVENPSNLPIGTFENRFPGYGPALSNNVYMAGGITFYFTTGGGLTLQNSSGTGDYKTGWFRQSGYYYWTNTAVGKFYENATAPTNNTDGTVVGTQV
jgi:hypothetical protein